jgi:hypothetical protein
MLRFAGGRAFEVSESVYRAPMRECAGAAAHANGIIATDFSVHIIHAQKCKAVLAMGDGFIFALESKRLLVRAVGN